MEMMFAMGLRTTFTQLWDSVLQVPWLIIRAVVVNYLIIPGMTLLLLLFFHTSPMAATGLLILAVCPAAPYGPPFTAIARGNLNLSVGLMVLLAGTSAFMAPLLLHLMLPAVTSDCHFIRIDAVKMIGSLFLIQLLPICLGLALSQWKTRIAEKLMKPASQISIILNLLMIVFICWLQLPLLADMHLSGVIPMVLLLGATILTGWLFGWPGDENRKALSIITALRNMSLGMVIVTGSFPGTHAVNTVLMYAFVAGFGLFLMALSWRIMGNKSV